MQGIGPVRRIVGLDRIAEAAALAHLHDVNDQPYTLPYEVKKTKRENAIIADILYFLPMFLSEYSIPSFAFRSQRIHIIELTDNIRRQFNIRADVRGFFMENREAVAVERIEDDLWFAGNLVHELLHLHSFVSFLFERQTQKVSLRRTGLVIKNPRGKRFFHTTNEAVIERLSRMFDRRYFPKMASLYEAVATRQRFINRNPQHEFTIQSVRTYQIEGGLWETTVRQYSAYENEWAEFNRVVYDIQNSDPTRYIGDTVFRVFVQAMFSGRLLPLARMICTALGKGVFKKCVLAAELKGG